MTDSEELAAIIARDASRAKDISYDLAASDRRTLLRMLRDAVAEGNAVRAENEKLRHSADQVETAETRIRDLQFALVKYGHHIPECEYLQDTLPCTCGFEALRSGLRQEGEHDAVLVEPDAACASWRCFHCDEVFTDRSAALEHFGESECHTPGCQIDITDVRAMEKALRQYRAEDTLLYRQLRHLKSDHATALRREEEKGYARGVADMREQLTAAIAALRDLVDYTDPAKDVSLTSASARVERARALLERLGAM